MGKCFTTIVGQSGWSRHCYWLSCFIRPVPSPWGRFGGL